ncbi:hypothetical protein Bca4012_064736 [Brassica carinata]|uniref:Stress-response A/B barrel domain-containing protein n=1 Tax=Brassica carinata TaxID=52824 RepID=A0A8X7RMX4_BRACI|nr:hypothetical protein Bca52824_038723 [Brassica carinata]
MSQIIEHIVLFKVKDDVDSVKIDAMVNGLNSLATIDQVLYLSAAPIHRLRSSSAFTHVLHSRYRSKEDLSAYIAHPDHLRVVEETMPIWEDIMSVDWIADRAPVVLKPPAGSVGKATLVKVKENVTDEAKEGIMEVVKEKSRGSDHEITVGENFSPARAKGFSIGSVAYFKDLGEVGSHEELVKEKVGGFVEDTIVVEFVVPPSS